MQQIIIRITGFFWLIAGTSLFSKGISLLSSRETLFIFLGVLIGVFKGYFVLQKTANRISERILSLKNPISFRNVYPISYWITIGFMSFLGLAFNFFGLPPKIRGFIDFSIGCALITGSIFYFKRPISKPSLSEKKKLL